MNFKLQSALLSAAVVCAGCFSTTPDTDLARAAHRGDLHTVRELLTPAVTADVATAALHWAARGGHAAGPHHCEGQSDLHLRVVDALIDAGADVHARDRRPAGFGRASGWTPLHTAVHHRQWAIARLLIEHGADPLRRSDQDVTPTQMATWIHAEKELQQKGTH